MHSKTKVFLRPVLGLGLLAAYGAALSRAQSPTAQQILDATGIRGGLIVHVSFSSPASATLTADLRANDRYTVQELVPDSVAAVRARAQIWRRGLCGPVSVDTWDGKRLPYVDNLVNLLVVSSPACRVPAKEVMRVLVPNGVAYILTDGGWTKTVKPWPGNIDEWTHYLHDSRNNAVAHDTVVGPPKHYQWQGTPLWSRHHELMSSTSALVSANGRLFHIFDEGSKASVLLPSKWFLTARDAFNGTILWKRRIKKWQTHLWPLKSGPADLPRRLVAISDRVYVTLGIAAPVSALDAATGETVRTYAGTEGTREIVVADGVLFLAIASSAEDIAESGLDAASLRDVWKRQRTTNCDGAHRVLMAVRAATGRIRWRHTGQVVPLSLAVAGGRTFYYDGDKMVCLSADTGEKLWESESLPRSKTFPSYYAPTLVVYKDVVLFTGGKNMLPRKGAQDTMQALSVKSGKLLWTAEHPPSGYQSPEDILVASGLVWTGAVTQSEDSGEFTGRDPLTGIIRKHYVPNSLPTTGYGHHRCFRGKATDRFVLTAKGGTNFLDVDTVTQTSYGWIRGVCLYGILPCNGLIYAPPHDCACNMDSKLYAFSAVAPESPAWKSPGKVSDTGRLERGPAYGEITEDEQGREEREKPGQETVKTQSSAHRFRASEDWPMYRRDPLRSGFTNSRVPAKLKTLWRAELGGRLSSPVVAAGKVFVVSLNAQTLQALDMMSGALAWRYTAGGRIDSPPTVWHGLVLFGAGDGYVHCLRARDGERVWRFRAAPADRRIMGFEQVESLWPVSGSVLVSNAEPGQGVVTCVAGRTPYLDGGMRLLRLDAKTGRKLSETILDNTHRGNKKRIPAPDILSSDGQFVYMKMFRFGLDGEIKGVPSWDAKEQLGGGTHLFSPTSLLDDAWWHRSYWVYGRAFTTTATGYYNAGLMAPSGRILAFDEKTVYGFGRKPKYYRWTTPLEYELFAADKERSHFKMQKQRRGKESSVKVPASVSFAPGNRPTTIEAWVKADSGNGVVVARGGKPDGLVLLVWAGKPKLVVRTKRELASISAPGNVINRWVHLAGVLTPELGIQLYVDGKLAGTAQLPRWPTIDAKEGLDIGLDSGKPVGKYKGAYGFVGMMDEVRVYDGALSPEDIRRHAAEPAEFAAAAPLAVRFSFDNDNNEKGDGHTGTAVDDSGSGRTGATTDLKFGSGKIGRAARFVGTRPAILKLPFAVNRRWTRQVPVLVRAMVLADKTLFIAGPPDLEDDEKAARNLMAPEIRAALREQDEASNGKRGGRLWAVSVADGRKQAEYPLASPPVFDGLIAAHGRLFISTLDGCLTCLGAEE